MKENVAIFCTVVNATEIVDASIEVPDGDVEVTEDKPCANNELQSSDSVCDKTSSMIGATAINDSDESTSIASSHTSDEQMCVSIYRSRWDKDESASVRSPSVLCLNLLCGTSKCMKAFSSSNPHATSELRARTVTWYLSDMLTMMVLFLLLLIEKDRFDESSSVVICSVIGNGIKIDWPLMGIG